MKKTLFLVTLLFGAAILWGQIFSTNFNNEGSWNNPGGSWTGYNEKTYSESGWFFHSTSSVRGGADEAFGGSAYAFRDRDIFSVRNSGEVNGVSGFSFQLRDWMLGDGEQRELKVSLDGGDTWDTVGVINKDWFDQYQVYQPFVYYFEGQYDFAEEDFQIQIINGGNTNNGRINIGQFQVLGEAEPSIIVNSPNGGEQWEQGSTHNILWSSVLFEGNVRVSLEMIDGLTRQVLVDDTENDGSWEWNIPAEQQVDDWYVIIVEGVNPGDPWDESDAPFSIIEAVNPLELSIYEIQFTEEAGDGTYPSMYVDELIQTQGIVSALFGNGFYIQDGTGAWNGINVYPAAAGFQVGDEIVIRGIVTEYYGKTEITDWEMISNNGQMAVPQPTNIMTGELASEEMYEGVLVKISGVTVTNPDLGFGEWEVDDNLDPSGPCVINDSGDYSYVPVLNDFIYSIIGIVDYNYDVYKLEPRSDADFNFGGFEVTPLSLEFLTTEACIDGLEFTIHNGSNDTVTINNMDTTGSFWQIEDFSLTLPYEMEAGAQLTFTVTVPLPTHKEGREIVTDMLNIDTSIGDFEITIYFEDDLISSNDETDVASIHFQATNYPNPFNPTTTISYSLPQTTDVELTIYNAKGQIVKSLVNEVQNTGNYSIKWEGKDNKNETVSSGIYFFKLTAGKNKIIEKMLMLK